MRKFFTLILFFLIANWLFAQNISVSGVVTDVATGETLIGVTVSVSGTTNATMTDADGAYKINALSNGKLTFSYVGYTQQIVDIRGRNVINVALKSEITELDAVVAIGYGTMRKSDLTGAVGSVSGEKLKAAPVSGLDKALQGQLAGVTVNSNSGQPGSNATIRVRGIGTINSPNPIYVVDGLIADNINYLSPSDIQSVEVLKDASAQAIYGSRGANGVILITTRKGTKGKSVITFDSYYGIQNRWKKLDVMSNGTELGNLLSILQYQDHNYFVENGLNAWVLKHKISVTSKLHPQILSSRYPNGLDLTQINTDWQDAVFVKDAPIQNHYLSMEGGGDNTTYMLSANYFNQQGTIINSSYKRLTLRLNTSYQMRKWLKVGENISFASSSTYNISNNAQYVGLLYSALSMAPWDPIKYPAGTTSMYARPPVDLSGQYSTPTLFANVQNPFNVAYNTKPYNNSIDIVGDFYLELTPIDGLTLRGDVSAKYWDGLNRNFTPVLDVTYNPVTRNSVSASLGRTVNMKYEGTATYHKLFAKKHDVTLMVGATSEDYNWYSVNASGLDLLNTDPKNWYVSRTSNGYYYNDNDKDHKNPLFQRSGNDGVSKERMVSFLGRLIYNFNDRYLLTASVREDGSSRLPPGHYWGVFPSFAGAWKISNEKFFEPLSNIFDNMKIRAGWGQLGNVSSLGLNGSTAQTTTGIWWVGYVLGDPNTVVEGQSLLSVPLSTVWEKTEQTDAGIDIGMLRNRLQFSVDFYNRVTHGMIMGVKPPGHIGYFVDAKGNAGDVQNRGVEFTLTHQNTIKDFTYNITANVSFVSNKLTALNGGSPLYNGIILQNEGYPLNTIYVLKYEGVFQNQAQIDAYTWTDPVTGITRKIQNDAKPGDAKYADTNNDGQITADDRYNAGNPFPKFTYGLNASLAWKGVDLGFFFQGISGNSVYNHLRQYLLEGDGTNGILGAQMRNVFCDVDNPLNPQVNSLPGSNGSIPNPVSTTGNVFGGNGAMSSRFVENASYLRLKNIELGYTFPLKATSIVGVTKFRVYISATNLLTFTKYTGYDPEVGNNAQDWGNYPQSRNLIFGLNMNF